MVRPHLHGWYAEAEYTLWDRFTFGGSLRTELPPGQQLRLDAGLFALPPEVELVRDRVHSAYKLTDWVAFQAEFINTKSINQSGGAETTNAFVAGTTFFF